jgi:hypothetical protein
MMQETANTLLRRLGEHAFGASAAKGTGLADDDVVKFALQAVHQARDTEHHQLNGDDAIDRP